VPRSSKRSSVPSRAPKLAGRDFLSVDDLSVREIQAIFSLARDVKKHPSRYRNALRGRMLALLFEKPSLRTRTTFTVGMAQLGGDSLTLTPAEINLGKRESVHDVAKNLERMVSAIMIRTFAHNTCAELAAHASIPVINGLTDLEHPCQAMADYFTILECGRDLRRVKVSYIGDGNNVAHSLMLGAGKLGVSFMVATPESYRPDGSILERARALASESGGEVVWSADPVEAARDADVIYTDTWASMGQEAEAVTRRRAFAPFQVNEELFSHARPEALFMHCLPAHRGQEVTDGVMDAPNSVVFQQAENRLHVQKALMLLLLR